MVHHKDCGDPEDIDLFRGGYSITASSLNKINEFKKNGLSALSNLSVTKLDAIIQYSNNAYYHQNPLLDDCEYEDIKNLLREKREIEYRLMSGK